METAEKRGLGLIDGRKAGGLRLPPVTFMREEGLRGDRADVSRGVAADPSRLCNPVSPRIDAAKPMRMNYASVFPFRTTDSFFPRVGVASRQQGTPLGGNLHLFCRAASRYSTHEFYIRINASVVSC